MLGSLLMMTHVTLIITLLSCAVLSVLGQTVSQLLSQPGWIVETSAAQVCSPSDCCCFTNVNIFISENELYINGTVVGNYCDASVKRDNLDPPNAYVFTQEFFGVPSVSFELANATYGSASGWSLKATSPTRPTCGFILFRTSNTSLPPNPTPNPIKPQNIPDYAKSYEGDNWYFDSSTCAVNDASCCCLVGSSSIVRDPSGVPSFFISASPSSGCGTSVARYQDDFPWPSSGTTTLSATSVTGFLAKQDNYQILYTTQGQTQTLWFFDSIQPKCSMAATRSTGGSASSGLSAGGVVGIVFAVLIVVGVGGFSARRYYLKQRHDSTPSPNSPLISYS